MPKRSRKVTRKPESTKRPKKRSRQSADVNEAAFSAVRQLEEIGSAHKNPFAVALGRLGGLRGGRARADKLSGEERKESARKAAVARWEKERKRAGAADENRTRVVD